jgi:hypothetical protein
MMRCPESLSEKGARLCRRPTAAHGKVRNPPKTRGRLRLVEDDPAALRDFQVGPEKREPGKSPNYLACTLRRWRARNGWPLKKVADEFGVTEATWSRWESGDRFPDHELIQPLANYVQVPICRFFCKVDSRCPFRDAGARKSA